MKNLADVERFEKAFNQLEEMRRDFILLSNKKPSEEVNLFKIGKINSFLDVMKKFLHPDFMPFEDFEKFDETTLPTNSDVLIVLNQYKSCLQMFIKENTVEDDFDETYWVISGKESTRELRLSNG